MRTAGEEMRNFVPRKEASCSNDVTTTSKNCSLCGHLGTSSTSRFKVPAACMGTATAQVHRRGVSTVRDLKFYILKYFFYLVTFLKRQEMYKNIKKKKIL